RNKSFAARVPIRCDQPVNFVSRQFDFSGLTFLNCMLEILPASFDRLNFLFRGVVLRNGSRRIGNRVRFRQEISSAHDCRVMPITPIETRATSQYQDKRENEQNETASTETTHSFLRRRLDPAGIVAHAAPRFSVSIFACASINFS